MVTDSGFKIGFATESDMGVEEGGYWGFLTGNPEIAGEIQILRQGF